MSDQPKVVVYTGAFCPYCTAAKNLLKKKGVAFEEVNVDKDHAMREEMVQRARRTSVPQIFIGDVHVGGFDDMAELNREGKLDRLLGLA